MKQVLIDLELLERCVDRWACCAIVETPGAEAAWLELRNVVKTAPQPEQSGLVETLEYYAKGDHLLLADPDAWDTCSGEPMNFLHDEAGTASIEDGSIAKAALEAYRAALSATPSPAKRGAA